MKAKLGWAASIPFSILLLPLGAGCDQVAPPLDELPLRDTLRADPDVVATLPDDARQRLAARFQAARAADIGDEAVDDTDGVPPDVLVARVDRLRDSRGQDAQVTGAIGAGVVHAVTQEPPATAAEEFLPAPDGSGASPATAALEARALASAAGAPLRALIAASGARHLQRVVGWPVGAVAAGDTVYVNASWLVALAPANPDGGMTSSAPARAAGTRAAPALQYDGVPVPAPGPDAGAMGTGGAGADGGAPDARPIDGGAPDARPIDGGANRVPGVDAGTTRAPYDAGSVYIPPSVYSWDAGSYYPPSTPTTPPPVVDDGCATACAAGTSDSSDDCSSTSDGSDDACQSSSDDGAACESTDDENGCQVARARRRGSNGSGGGTLLTLVAPLAFLLPRRRRS